MVFVGSWKDQFDPRGRSSVLGVYGGKGLAPGGCTPLQQIVPVGPQPALGTKTTNYSRRSADFWHFCHFAPPPLLVSFASLASAFAALRPASRSGHAARQASSRAIKDVHPPSRLLKFCRTLTRPWRPVAVWSRAGRSAGQLPDPEIYIYYYIWFLWAPGRIYLTRGVDPLC